MERTASNNPYQGTVARFIEALRGAGANPAAEDVADALWLLLQVDPREGEFLHLEAPTQRPSTNTEPDIDTEQDLESSPEDADTGVDTDSDGADLLPEVAGGGVGQGGALLKTALAPALPGSVEIARALRPFRRRVSSRTHYLLDEQMTAQRSAEERMLTVALRPMRMRWFAVDLVIDESGSMAIWRRTAIAFQRALVRLGAFRHVRVWRLNADDARMPSLYAGLAGRTRGAIPRSFNELIDPSGQRIILVFSDCVSPAWHSGAMARVIAGWKQTESTSDLVGWGRVSPVAIVQVLPQDLWRRTSLAREARVSVRSSLPGVPNSLLAAQLDDPEIDAEDGLPQGLPVPVFSLEPHLLGRWARMVSASQHSLSMGYILNPTGRRLPPINPVRQLGPRQLVQSFIARASHEARDLALLLATMPVTLPVINLIQATVLPRSRQVHAAEVLLSGMLRQSTLPELVDDPNEIAYEFVDGVRELLIEMAPLVHPVEVLDRVATYITEMRGQGEQMLSRVSGLPGSEDRGGSATLPFARINANLLYGLGLTGDTVPAAARDRDPVRSAPVFKEGNAKSLEKIDPQLSQGTADIERQLRDVLPAESHTHIVHIAQLLNNMASGRIDPEVLRERFTAGPEIAALLNQLAGQQFNLGTTIISFMAGNQLGEVSIHEVAEGSVVSYNITPEPTKIRSLSRGRSTAGQNQRKLRVFFSYSSVDRPAVRQLSQLLAEAGVVPWLAEEQLMPGQSLSSELSKEIENSDVVLICLSREAVNQMSLQQEINKALIAIESRPVGEMILIPVLLEPCIVPKQLARWDRVELATPQGMSHLMRALQILAEDIGVLIPHLPTGGEREYSLVTQKEPAPSIGNIELNQLWQQALSASERADWAYAEFLLAQIAAADPVYRDVQSRLTEVRRKIELHTELRALHEANNWAAVLDRLEALDQQQLDYLGTEELRRWALNRRRYEERYRAALEATNEGDWNNAISILEPLLLSFPDDARAMALLELSRQELVKQQADKTEGPYEISASGEASSSVTDGVTLHSRPQFFADVLLITVSDIETEGVRDALAERHGRSFSHTLIGAKIYYDLGVLGGARTFLVRSEMGAGGVGGALLTTATAISDLAPAAIVMLGIAFGLRPQQQALGDILVSRQLMFYDLQRVGSDDAGRLQLRARGDRPAASPWLLDRFRSGRDDWRGAALHFGLILSSDKLVGDQGFREQLLQLEPEAIGGEMEGAGLYAAAQHQRVDWILVKAISDWADGQKAQGKAEQQRQAARNAADFILHVLEQGGMVRQAPRPTAPAASAPAAPPGRLPQLRQLLTDRLGSEELNTLCFDLGIDPEDLPAQSRAGKARELIGYLERRRSIDKLLAWLRQHRPDIDLD